MLNKPEIHLSIPDLFTPLLLWNNDYRFQVQCDSLSILLSSLEFIELQKVQGLSVCFFSNLVSNLDWQKTELPIAYFRIQTHKILSAQPDLQNGMKSILCADPVHFEVGMNDVTLTESITDLGDDETQEILSLLNDHFQQDDLEFVSGNNQHWYVIYPSSGEILTTPLEAVMKKNVVGKLPSSNRNWHQIQNEAQMLLHNSEVNKNREMAGLKPLNSLWFWGGGKPKTVTSTFNTIFSNTNQLSIEIQAKTFAKAASSKWEKLPENGSDLLAQIEHKPEKHYVLIDQLQQAVFEENLDTFQEELTRLDEEYIKPLLLAWKKNQIDLVVDGADGCPIRPIRTPSWKFWVKPQQLTTVAALISNQPNVLERN